MKGEFYDCRSETEHLRDKKPDSEKIKKDVEKFGENNVKRYDNQGNLIKKVKS